MNLGYLTVMWDLKTTGLSVYQQEHMEIGCAILQVVSGIDSLLMFEQVRSTVSQLTFTDVVASGSAVATHGTTPQMLTEGDVALLIALKN